MSKPLAWSAAALALGACASYQPAPVDLAAHGRDFAARMPDAAAVRAFVASVRGTPAAADGAIDRDAAHTIALWCNPDLRVQRLRAGVATVDLQHAGRWLDPELGIDLARILDGGPDAWITGASIAFSVPLSGRPGREQDLASAEQRAAALTARIAELQLLDALDLSWSRWSAAQLRAEVLRDQLAQVGMLQQIADRLLAAHEIDNLAARTFALETAARQGELLRAEADVAAAAQARNALLGLPPDRELPFAPAVAVASRAPAAAERTQRLADGPLLAPGRSEHDLAEQRLALAVAEQWPDLQLAPGLGREDGKARGLLAVTLPLPLWNGNQRAIARAEAERDVAAAALRAALEHAVAELARADLQQQTAGRLRAHVDSQLVPLAEQQLRESRRLAELGRLDVLLLLDALSRITAAKTAAIDAALAEAEATVATNALFWPAPQTTEDSR